MNAASTGANANLNPYIKLTEEVAGARFEPGNTFELLQNGDEIFPAMLEAIRGAQHSVEFLTYVFWRGRIASAFAEALAERARAGVKVRVLIDTFGGATMDSRTIWTMERAGVKLGWFRPGHNLRHLRKLNNRTHRKILIIDDQTGFTGGVGIADMWTGHAQDKDHWRETHCHITGPACAGLHAGFAENWFEATTEQLAAPTPKSVGAVAVQAIISTAGARPTVAEQLLMAVFAQASRRLWITTGYFVPTGSIIEALIAAAGRGVDVRVLTNGRHTDHHITMRAGRSSYTRLLEGGVKVYEYDRTMHHAKIISADSAWATLGSINLDARSLVLNDELNVAVTDPDIISALDLQFLEDLKHANHIRSTDWHQRGRLARLVESSSSVFRHQL